MRNIDEKLNESLNEGRGNWTFSPRLDGMGNGQPLQVGDAKWLQICTEGQLITPVTERDLSRFEEDYDDEEITAAIRKLKIGESYDADGGLTVYIRIAK